VPVATATAAAAHRATAIAVTVAVAHAATTTAAVLRLARLVVLRREVECHLPALQTQTHKHPREHRVQEKRDKK
jgi:hypothetical protein